MRNGITATGSVGVSSTRVLVVEDEFSLRRTLTIALRAARYQVTSAANSVEALERLRLTTFNVVITDLMMPGMNGIELLKAIKHRSPETKVILLTADFDPQLATDAVTFGAFGCVQKAPCGMIAKLTKKVEQALNHSDAGTKRQRLSQLVNWSIGQ